MDDGGGTEKEGLILAALCRWDLSDEGKAECGTLPIERELPFCISPLNNKSKLCSSSKMCIFLL